jgi:hypothetical protein
MATSATRKHRKSRRLFVFLVVLLSTGHRVIVTARNSASAMHKARRAKGTVSLKLKDGRTIGVSKWPFYGTSDDRGYTGRRGCRGPAYAWPLGEQSRAELHLVRRGRNDQLDSAGTKATAATAAWPERRCTPEQESEFRAVGTPPLRWW